VNASRNDIQPSTTHSEWGAGHPHLIVSRDGTHRVFDLAVDSVRIGGSPESELSLTDIDPLHAEILHDVNDEYVLIPHGAMDLSHAPMYIESVDAEGEILRTGARFTMGGWTFVYARDEYADHGRPYGGREGGEGTHQPRQPERPDYTGDTPADAPAGS
jgi:hypothetical protein